MDSADGEPEQSFTCVLGHTERKYYIHKPTSNLTVGSVQMFLDAWLKKNGGVEEMDRRAHERADMLYSEIDRNKLFRGTVAEEDRSLMNICFVMNEEYKDLEKPFFEFATERGMVGIKGHRSVGGFRASLYNPLPLESVKVLVAAIKEFENNH